MSAATLEEKLDARDEKNPEHAWNLARWPSRFSTDGDNRLFVAVDGLWRGYFVLAKDALYNPDDPRTPYTLLFDTRTWTPLPPTPVKRFRGFTYKVPSVPSESTDPTPPTPA